MRWRVEFTQRAADDLTSLPRPVLRRVDERILRLREDPRPPGCAKLRGADDAWRLRVGEYRILYTIARVLHRRVAYRRTVPGQ